MFERYLTDALTNHFGHVLEGLDEKQVRLSVWNGQVSLHNVRLKRNALDSFIMPPSSESGSSTSYTAEAPVEILHGRVGTLALSIPWNVLRQQLTKSAASSSSNGTSSTNSTTTQPFGGQQQVSLVLTDVNILVTPRKEQEQQQHSSSSLFESESSMDTSFRSTSRTIIPDEGESDQNQNILHVRAEKENQVQSALNAMLLKRLAESSAQGSSSSKNDNDIAADAAATTTTTAAADASRRRRRWQWLQDRLAGLFANLSVTIRNIHVRYEDPGTCLGFSWTTSSNAATANANTATRYRPAFCVGITLRQFDIHSVVHNNSTTQHSSAVTTTTLSASASADDDSAVVVEDNGEDNAENGAAAAAAQAQAEDTANVPPPSNRSSDSTANSTNSDNVASVATTCAQQEAQRHAPSRVRQKRAAAEQLAVYWDSGARRLMSERAEQQKQKQRLDNNNGEDEEDNLNGDDDDDDFFRRAFSNLNEMTQGFYSSINNSNDDKGGGSGCSSSSHHQSTTTLPATPLVGRNDEYYNSPHHAFVLDPFSPCVLFQLVVSTDAATGANDSAAAAAASRTGTNRDEAAAAAATSSSPPPIAAVPPSSVQAHLPPCRLTLSRSLLEDVGYLRKSFAVWAQTVRHGPVVSEYTLQKLARLRPAATLVNNKFDARAWWKYAYYAVCATLQTDHSEGVDHDARHFLGDKRGTHYAPHTRRRRGRRRKRHRPRGWLGLSQALADRRRYVDLYKQVFGGNDTAKEDDRCQEAHEALLEMELAQLSIDEIVAFRIHLHQIGLRCNGSTCTSTATTPRSGTMEDLPEKEEDGAVLSLEYRCRMFAEMTLALDREQRIDDGQDEESKTMPLGQHQQQRMAQPVENYHGLDNCRNPIAWTTSITCPEVSLRVDDRRILYRHRDRPSPVVRVSCAFSSEQCLYLDGSWELSTRIGSLKVKDLTTKLVNSNPSSNARLFPLLVGPKHRRQSSVIENDVDNSTDESNMSVHQEAPFYIDGVAHEATLSLRIRRSQHAFRNPNRGSTTTTTVRVLPLEVCYSTAPVEALSRILNTANLDVFLADDYHRIRTKMYEWRERSKQRLLAALSHKQKNIIVDIDVGNPTILIPEKGNDNNKRDGPLLVVDLGRLKVSNANEVEHESMHDEEVCDDGRFQAQWRVELARIQVQCSSTNLYRQRQSLSRIQHVVEPFSLIFAISTRLGSRDDQQEDGNSVVVVATLPRLAFNFTASAVRLIQSLRDEWSQRRRELQPSIQNLPSTTSVLGFATGTDAGTLGHMKFGNTGAALGASSSPRGRGQVIAGRRKFEFRFVAPLLSLKLENDVDGRDCSVPTPVQAAPASSDATTPIVDLAFRGIEGNLVHETSSTGAKQLSATAKLHSVHAVDLYQSAGDDYAMLLSSVAPETMPRLATTTKVVGIWDQNVDRHSSGMDLVAFEYISVSGNAPTALQENGPSASNNDADKLNIHFHELFVEWNPETLAAIHKAIKAPNSVTAAEAVDDEQSVGSDDFYDAEEDEFQDAGSVDPEEDEECPISEISSSRRSSYSDLTELQFVSPGVTFQSPISTTHLLSPPRRLFSPWLGQAANPIHAPDHHQQQQSSSENKRFEVSFELSKLRVNFNKESRHRRLVTAEMDQTSVSYANRSCGGYAANVTIGNLSFADADSQFNRTLYREIIGLKTDSASLKGGQSSLLEMSIVKNPRRRRYTSGEAGFLEQAALDESVSVDVSQGRIRGCDTSLKAKFSPMRFVYLQQLWFEVVDYFFEGIIGYEVWGNQRPASAPVSEIRLGPPSNAIADNVRFTLLDVDLESPVILIPVSYCSTDFLRVEADRITLSNRYDYRPMRLPETPAENAVSEVRQQWFNNCSTRMESLIISSWSGTRLSQDGDQVTARVELNWPTGPTAPLNKPKWKVDCSVDELNVLLSREDFALLQHVIASNICEVSRNLDEWHALQNLPRLVLERYKEDIMVHFGYDKKDVTPSTFDVAVTLPCLLFSLQRDEQTRVADIRCVNVVWKYLKLADLVSRQQVTCEAYIVGQDGNVQAEMLSAQDAVGSGQEPMVTPRLTYTSTTQPTGDNVKSLEIDDACIHVGYRPWRQLSDFFQSLPSPKFLSPESVIQVGDRWYKIAGQSSYTREANMPREYTWIASSNSTTMATISTLQLRDPSYDFHLRLVRPRIALESDESAIVLSINNVDFSHHGKSGLIRRTFVLEEIKVQTRSSGQPMREPEASLIHPLRLSGSLRRCNGQEPCRCGSHSHELEVGNISATAAFTDLSASARVCTNLLRDLKSSKNSQSKPSLISRVERSLSSASLAAAEDHELLVCGPPETLFRATCQSIDIAVVDDSRRHFAAAQELVILSLGLLAFTRKESMPGSWHSSLEGGMGVEQSMTLCLDRMELMDCLQSKVSPFRTVASLTSSDAMQEGGEIGQKVIGARAQRRSNKAVLLRAHFSGDHTRYTADLNDAVFQYNPSMIIALQRFLGRLRKSFLDVSSEAQETILPTNEDSSTTEPSGHGSILKASVSVKSLSLRLNKEHQGRSLLEFALSDTTLDGERSQHGLLMKGGVGELSIWDTDSYEGNVRLLDRYRPVVKVSQSNDSFLQFRYQTFSKRRLVGNDVPEWVARELHDESAEIDDVLTLSVASVEAVYLSRRTKEVLDYMGNGLPGKGMGFTSRAAKGFVKHRIQKRSFLQVQVDAPLVIIPQEESEDAGLVFGGDVNVKSWVDSPDATRMVSLSLSGFSGGFYRGGKMAENIVSDLSISADMSRTVTNRTKLQLRLSDVFARISYTDYVLGLLVLRKNVGRKIDRSQWDNLEVAWEAQGCEESPSPRNTEGLYSMDVPYAADARHVRYGLKKAQQDKVHHPRLDFDVQLEDLAVVLRRDDPAETSVIGLEYDMMLFRGKGFEATFNSFDGGDSSFFSIRRILVLDLGGRGRMLRAGVLELGERTPSMVAVLAEGYTALDSMQEPRHKDEYAQVVARVDRTTSTLSETKLSLVINHLSVAALIRPLQDFMDFLNVKVPSVKAAGTDGQAEEPSDVSDESPLSSSASNRVYQIRLVLHHPRFIFVAHEADPHSRALVLRGLAIINGNYGKRVKAEEDSTELDGIVTTVNADFQNISSYILPDVSDMVHLQHRHSELVGDILPDVIPKPSFYDSAEDDSIDFDGVSAEQSIDNGVALLLPVTVGIEFEQIARTGCPTNRSLAINMDPLSLMISSEDMQLITALNKKWRSRNDDAKRDKDFAYELEFHSETLGLGLRKEGTRIVVDATREESMETGDFLISVNGDVLEDVPLAAVVERLKTEPRPVRLGFSRIIQGNESLHDAPEPSTEAVVRKSYIDSWDLSLTEATFTMISNEIPILRGNLTGARLHLGRRDEAALFLRFSVLATISIDYYHVRIWTWEPFLEPGSCSLSAEFSDPRQGPKALAVEVGDSDTGPLSFNVTHACASALSKLQEWDGNSDCDTFDEGEPNRAANAALQFAKRQKSSAAKPYVFRNLTGVSCAFVIQRKQKDIAGAKNFVTVGDYNGLKSSDSPEIVAPGEETKFRLDRPAGSMRADGIGRLPGLTVAFQAMAGINIDPLENLQIVRAGETLFPLSYMRTDDSGGTRPSLPVWISWQVDLSDEMTTLTIASTFRIVSPLHTQIEVGVVVDERSTVKSLGYIPKDDDGLCLPLWLCLRPMFWLFVRPPGGYHFASLYDCRTEEHGAISGSTEYIECHAKKESQPNAWLAATNVRKGGATLISIGCCLNVRNALPTSIAWEISTNILQSSCTIDGSTSRGMLLESGQAAEVMGGQHAATIHIRLRREEWSTWVALSLDNQGDSVNTRSVSLKDTFGVPFVVGIRIARRPVGLEATLFAEMWFVNTTPMNISFGAPFEQVIGPLSDDSTASEQEVSAAEAALKEISSLFETGEEGTGIRQSKAERSTPDVVLLAGHAGTLVTEECFEYIDVDNSIIKRRWWASENPNSSRKNLTKIHDDGETWQWVDPGWRADLSGKTCDGWESAPNLWQFSKQRDFNSSHRFRRRRWMRSRETRKELVNAVYQRTKRPSPPRTKPSSKPEKEQPEMQFAIQVNGGRWALTSYIPVQGVVYGAMRATSAKWPQLKSKAATSTSVFELCYSISPLDQDWGDLTRLFIVSSRFLLRNDSQQLTLEMKQVGSGDSTAVVIGPGASAPFHWANFHLPELICTRPVVKSQGRSYYKWSGGFDPVTIGVVPLRIRKVHSVAGGSSYRTSIKSLKMEAEIRPGTGGTGINLSFAEEDENGEGSLFRIDNFSPFPIWAIQDGILANFSLGAVNEGANDGDLVRSNEQIPFALDVPFRQGKYAHRKAATIEELLKVRLGLAPLNSRSGIETARLVSLSSVGSTVRLNPSKLMILDDDLRSSLQQFRVVGMVTNDGPTRVLRLVLAEKEAVFPSFPNPFDDDVTLTTTPYCSTGKVGSYTKEIVAAARIAVDGHDSKAPRPRINEEEERLPERLDASPAQSSAEADFKEDKLLPVEPSRQVERDLIISFRMAFSGFIVSLVDSSPAEIAVVTLKNVNTLASWNALRTTDATIYITISHFQIDNMVPNAPYPVAVCPDERARNDEESSSTGTLDAAAAPVLVVGLSFAPRHKSGIVILRSVTVAPRNLAVRVDLAFLVRLQKFALDIQQHFVRVSQEADVWKTPDINQRIADLEAAARSGVNSQKFYLGGLTILPCNIKLSVAPARALTAAEASFEGDEAAAIHQAVRKGDVRLGNEEALLGVKLGSRNATPMAVVRGVFKSIVVDALLRLDGASLNFAGVSLRNHIATRQQLTTHIGAHYTASLRQNVPALLGSLSALGNPVGLVRGLGDGVSDFVLEPVRGFQRSVQEMDASYLVDGVARGTLSLARHTVGGFAYSAAALAETFSKNMTVLTLDRRYAQKRDRGDDLRTQGGDINVALGLGSGVNKLAQGFVEGVTGVVRAPIRGAEKRGFEGFAKGIGKGLLGLLVKPIIGISDGFTDVMIGVKGSMDGAAGGAGGGGGGQYYGSGSYGSRTSMTTQIRPRRPLYGKDRAIRAYNMADAAASALMLRTRLGGEHYRSHVDMGDRVALLSVKRLLLLGPRGDELLVLKYKHIDSLEIRSIQLVDGSPGFGIIIILNTPRRNGSEVEVINCTERAQAVELCTHIEEARRNLSANSNVQIQSTTTTMSSSSSSSAPTSPQRSAGGGVGDELSGSSFKR